MRAAFHVVICRPVSPRTTERIQKNMRKTSIMLQPNALGLAPAPPTSPADIKFSSALPPGHKPNLQRLSSGALARRGSLKRQSSSGVSAHRRGSVAHVTIRKR